MVKKIIKLPFAPVLITPLVLFLPILLGGKSLFWGTPVLQFIPWRDWAWETIQAGHLPLWNPLVGMGAPLFANYQSALLYPLNWLTLLFHAVGDTPAMAWSHTLIILAHLIWAGIGMTCLMKNMGQNETAQAVSGLSYSMSGYLVSRAGFFSINAASAWLPWLLLLSLKLVKTGTVKNFLKLTAVIALQLLAGHAQTAFYSLILTGVWIVYWSWDKKDPTQVWSKIKNILSAVGVYVCSGILAAAIAAVQLWPTFEYLLQSHRASAVEYELAMTYSFWPWRFLTLLAPNLFGNPVLGNYWGYANYWEDAIYIGLLPVLLAFGFLVKSVVRSFQPGIDQNQETSDNKSGLAIFLGGIILISFILALGKNTFIFPWLYKNVPSFDQFHAPTRFSIWAVMGLSVLAGFGVGAWKRPEGRGLYWARLGTAGAVAVGIGAGLAWVVLEGIKPTFILPTSLAGLWGAGTGILALTAPEKHHELRYRNRWKWAVVLWVAVDLLVAGWGLNPGIDTDYYHVGKKYSVDMGRYYLPPEMEYDMKFNQFFMFESFDPGKDWQLMKEAYIPNWNMLVGQAMVNNFDPIVPGRYQQWMEAVDDTKPGVKKEILKMMGTSRAAVHQGESRVEFQDLPGNPTLTRWVPCSQFYDSPDLILAKLMAGQVDYGNTVLIESEPVREWGCIRGADGYVKLIEQHPNSLSYKVESSHAGWVLRSSVWYPGWNAYIDGKQVPLYRGNYLFQAVQVPEGNHDLHFKYRPLSVRLGAVVSVFGVVAAVVLGVSRKKLFNH